MRSAYHCCRAMFAPPEMESAAEGHHLALDEVIRLHKKSTEPGPRSALYETNHPATPAATNTLATTLKGLQPPTPAPNFA
jgi:hypothetical protein